MPAQVGEEVVVHPDPAQAQYLGENAGHLLLGVRARRNVGLSEIRPRPLRGGECLTIDLTVVSPRQCLEDDEVSGHHVFGARAADQRAQLVDQVGRRLVGDEVSHESLVPGDVFARDHHDVAHRRMSGDVRLDLPGLDPESPHFDLVIDPPQALETSVGKPTCQIPRAVHPRPGLPGEGVRHELLGRQIRTLPVPSGDPDAPDAQLPRHPRRHRLEPGVHHPHLRVRNRTSDRDHTLAWLHPPRRRPHRGLRRPIHVPDGGDASEQLVRQIPRQRLSPTQHLQARVSSPTRLEQQAPSRRRRLHHGGSRRRQPAHQPFAIQRVVPARQHDPRALDQRQVQLQRRDVERQRRHGQQHVRFSQARLTPHRLEQVHQRTVRNGNAFRAPGRARGEDHICQVLGANIDRWIAVIMPGDLVRHAVHADDQGLLRRQTMSQPVLRDQHAHGSVFDHSSQAFSGIGGVQRNVGPARLENAEQRHHHVQRALGEEPDEHIRADPEPPQMVRESVGAPVELAVGQVPLVDDHGHAVGRALSLRFDQLVKTSILRVRHGGVIPIHHELLLLGAGEQRQRGNTLVRLADDPFQQRPVMPAQPLYRRGVEEVGAVFHQPFEPPLGLGEEEGQIKLGCAGPQYLLGGQVRYLRHTLGVMQHEHHLEQGGAAGVPLRRQFGHQVLEGQVRMRIGPEGLLPHLLEQAVERQPLGEPRAQHHHVDEVPDQRLRFTLRATGNGGPHQQVVLPRIAVQQGRKTGLENHEQRGLVLAPQRFQPLHQRHRQRKELRGAAKALHGRPRLVGGQVQHRGRPRQRLPPVRQLPLQHVAADPLPLPAGKIRILDRHGRQRRRPPVRKRLVQLADFPLQQLHRPLVRDDVVDGQQQPVLLGGPVHHGRAHQRRVRQVERLAPLLLHHPLPFAFPRRLRQRTHIVLRQHQVHRRLDDLHRVAVPLRKRGAQDFMPPHHLLQRPPQRRRRVPSFEAHHIHDVVDRTAGSQLVEKPELFLRERQRPGTLRRARPDPHPRPLALPAPPSGPLPRRVAQHPRQSRNRRMLEHRARLTLHPEDIPDPRHHLDRQQRMPAQVEEVVVDTDLLHPQQFGPNGGERLLGFSEWPDEILHGLSLLVRGGGQRLAINFAVGRQRKCFHQHECRRDHVRRQPVLEVLAERRGRHNCFVHGR